MRTAYRATLLEGSFVKCYCTPRSIITLCPAEGLQLHHMGVGFRKNACAGARRCFSIRELELNMPVRVEGDAVTMGSGGKHA